MKPHNVFSLTSLINVQSIVTLNKEIELGERFPKDFISYIHLPNEIWMIKKAFMCVMHNAKKTP